MLFCSIESKDWILFLLNISASIIVTILWTLILFFRLFKPIIKIEEVTLNGKILKVKVINADTKRNAVNLKLEACFIGDNNTFHLKIDLEDFIMLPPNDHRKFKISGLGESALDFDKTYEELLMICKAGELFFRVRVHANHENSGFGKAFEGTFKYDGEKFIKK